MNRREFLAAAAACSVGPGAVFGAPTPLAQAATPTRRLRFAPHTGMFRNLAGDDPVDQIQFAADQGFDGFEDIALFQRPRREQERIAAAIGRRNLELGPVPGLVELSQPSFVSGSSVLRRQTLLALRRSLECAARTGAKFLTVIPGRKDVWMFPDRQIAQAIALLRECADLCAEANVVMLLEPVDAGAASPALIRTFADGVELCRIVGRADCRVVCDVYAIAMSDSDETSVSTPQGRDTSAVLKEIDRGWDQIGSIAWGDAPGRKEPGTGRLDFAAIRKFLTHREYSGLIRMDHGNAHPGEEGEQAVLDAYRTHS